jgi:hypothetical protein
MCRRVVMMKNQWAISPQLSSFAPQGINKPFQHLHIKYLINSGPFGYKFKVDDTSDVEKAWTLTSVVSLAWGYTIKSFYHLWRFTWRFMQFNTNFAFTFCSVWAKLTTHSDLTSCCSTNTERTLSKLFPCELCLVASPNTPSNSVARSTDAKLKMSHKTYFPDSVSRLMYGCFFPNPLRNIKYPTIPWNAV